MLICIDGHHLQVATDASELIKHYKALLLS